MRVLAESIQYVEMSALIGAYVAIIGVIMHITKHTGDVGKHPQTKDVVFRDTCADVKSSVNMRFVLQEKAIDDARKTAAQNLATAQEGLNSRVSELKTDMLREFEEVKVLVRANGNGKKQ